MNKVLFDSILTQTISFKNIDHVCQVYSRVSYEFLSTSSIQKCLKGLEQFFKLMVLERFLRSVINYYMEWTTLHGKACE